VPNYASVPRGARQINIPSSCPAKYASACAVPSSYGMAKRGLP
jgi:hypothetical protein